MSASGIQAGSAYVRIFGDKSALVRELKGAGTDLSNWASSAGRIGGALLGVGAAGGAGLAKTTQMFANTGSELDDMSQRTGVAGSKLSQFQYGLEQSGADLPTLETGLKKMQDGLVWPSDTQKANATLAELRINASKFRGATGDEQFIQLAEAISRIEDPAARTAAAIDVFGKSGTQLLPFLKEGRAGIEALMSESDRLGLTLSDDDIASAAKLGDTYDRVAATAKRAGVAIGAALAPAAEEAANAIAEATGAASKWISENRGVVTVAAAITGATAAAGVGVIGLGVALKAGSIVASAASIAWMACGTALAFLTSPIGLVVAALGAAAYASGTTGDEFSEMVGDALPEFNTLKTEGSAAFSQLETDAKTALSGIRAALASGDLSAAAGVAWSLIELEWTRGITGIEAKYAEFKDTMAGAFSRLYVDGIDSALQGWNLIQNAWDAGSEYLSSVWDSVADVMLSVFDRLAIGAQGAGKVIGALVNVWAEMISQNPLDVDLVKIFTREFDAVDAWGQEQHEKRRAKSEQRSKDMNVKRSEGTANRSAEFQKRDSERQALVDRMRGDIEEQAEIDAANRRQRIQDATVGVQQAEEKLKTATEKALSTERKSDDKKKKTSSDGPGGTAESKSEVRGTTQAGVASQLAFSIGFGSKPTTPPPSDDPTKSAGRANAVAAENAMMAANRRDLPPGAADQLNGGTYADRQNRETAALEKTLKVDLGDGIGVLAGKLDAVVNAINGLEALYA